MIAIVLILVAGSLPACFAITAASRAGAKGWSGYLVWSLEAAAGRLIAAARWLRDFDAWRHSRTVEVRSA